jgi:hypothetical protein
LLVESGFIITDVRVGPVDGRDCVGVQAKMAVSLAFEHAIAVIDVHYLPKLIRIIRIGFPYLHVRAVAHTTPGNIEGIALTP